MELRRAFFLLLALSASILINLWWDYPISDYGFGSNLSTTAGQITSVEVAKKAGRSRYAFFEPIIKYQYRVNGTSYNGAKIAMQPISARTKEEISAISARYSVGSIQPVYYSAANPNFSLLDKTFPWGLVLNTIVLIPAALIFSGVFLTLFGRS
jgi:Protein of unknown function (DUF3592)